VQIWQKAKCEDCVGCWLTGGEPQLLQPALAMRSGSTRDSNTWANTLPGTERRVMVCSCHTRNSALSIYTVRRWYRPFILLGPYLWPILCRIACAVQGLLELSMEYLSSSAVMLSDPADLQFFCFPKDLATSKIVGASVWTPFSLGVKVASLSIPSCHGHRFFLWALLNYYMVQFSAILQNKKIHLWFSNLDLTLTLGSRY